MHSDFLLNLVSLWSTGCLQQMIKALHRCGLSVAYSSVLSNLAKLADHCMQMAIDVGSGAHVFCYDNIQLSTLIYVEQHRSSRPAKVTLGTSGILSRVHNRNPAHMKLSPILECFRISKGLDSMHDLCLLVQQLKSVDFQTKVVIVQVLIMYCTQVESYAADPALQHWP